MIPAETQTSLVSANSGYVALNSNALEIIKENLKTSRCLFSCSIL